ncbi:MAG TPA: flagellar biosynthesis protein FliQ [Stellaceae bacterium]
MTANDAVDIARDAIIVALKLGAPIMLIGLVVGLIVSFFQAITQIQEQTLTFVPKIIVIMGAMLLLLPFMLSTLADFTHLLMDRIVSAG